MVLTRWFFVLLVSGVVSYWMNETMVCPYEECVCNFTQLLMTCKDLLIIPPLKSGENVTAIETIIFQGGNLTNIQFGSLPSNMVNVAFINTPINYVNMYAFQESAMTLTTLYFKKATFTDLPTAIIQLRRLTTFIIHDMKLDSFNHAVLENMNNSIRKLELRNVAINSFPTWLSIFKSLITLDLSRNPLTTIPDNALSHLKYTLKNVILEDIGLSFVSKGLSNLNNLDRVNLVSNKLTDLKGIPCTVELSVSNNNISDSDALVSALRPCAHVLSVLAMTSNKLTVIPDLSNMTHLKCVYLDKNLLSDSIHGSLPTSLTYLYLQGNRLISIPTIIGRLPKLSTLDLSYNQLTEINAESLPVSLTELYLNGNLVTEITESSFRVGNSLERLFLESNPISTISPLAFTHLDYISDIYLGGTKLTKVPLALTKIKTKLRILNLRNIYTLICSCPPDSELVNWYRKENSDLVFVGTCVDGRYVNRYLSDNFCYNIAVNRDDALGTTVKGSTAFGKTVTGSTALGTTVTGSTALGTTVTGSTALGTTVTGSTALGTTVNGCAALGTPENDGSDRVFIPFSSSCCRYIYLFAILSFMFCM